jgi:type 1 glutamine amidotransferase
LTLTTVPGRLLAITGGHRFDLDSFGALLDAVCGTLRWEWTHSTQPEAQRWLCPEHAGTWDAIVLHDIPGLDLARGTEPASSPPTTEVRDGVLGLLAAGQGIVATHHALAGWPTWDEWAGVLGGRFLYAPGRLRGTYIPASGYRMATYRVDVVNRDHPVCAGVEPFEVTDELYLCPVFEDEVTPLLATDADISAATMIDTYREVRFGERAPAAEQRGSRLVGWARVHGPSRIVYVLPGHSGETMRDPQYRLLLANACAWVAGRGSRNAASPLMR